MKNANVLNYERKINVTYAVEHIVEYIHEREKSKQLVLGPFL